jgi:hypothetical protein
MSRPGPVDAHQDRTPAAVSLLVVGRQLPQRGADHRDVVGGGVRAGVAAAQQHRHRLPGPGLTVVDERGQRVMPEPALERRRREFLVRVRGHQGGINIHDQRPAVIDPVIRSGGPGPGPDLSAGGGAGGVDRRARLLDIAAQRGDQPGHRRVRGHGAEHRRCLAQGRDISQAVPADGE